MYSSCLSLEIEKQYSNSANILVEIFQSNKSTELGSVLSVRIERDVWLSPHSHTRRSDQRLNVGLQLETHPSFRPDSVLQLKPCSNYYYVLLRWRWATRAKGWSGKYFSCTTVQCLSSQWWNVRNYGINININVNIQEKHLEVYR